MNRLPFGALLAASLLTAAPAFAATDIPVPPFKAISVHGGGHVTLMHGATQRVTLIKGDPKIVEITVHGGTLDLSPCRTSCWFRNAQLDVEVVSPSIEAVEAHGGGDIHAKGQFPQQAHISVSAHGGGDVDIRAIPAENVSAEVHGGGDVHLTALTSLSASAHGGGDIVYSGNPKKISSSTHGGGDIRHE